MVSSWRRQPLGVWRVRCRRRGLGVGLVVVLVLAVAQAAQAASWAAQSVPTPLTPNGALLAVACSGLTACTAVGHDVNSAGTQVALAEVWDGSSWQLQSTPNPAGATSSQLSGVSCSSATACIAVGDYYNSAGTELTLAEVWDGSSWQLQSTPNPAGATSSQLDGVSCPEANACTAVGSNAVAPLAEVWDGSSWQLQSAASPIDPYNGLTGVSCSSATACTAVGNYVSKLSPFTISTFAEAWDGSSWQVQSTVNPGGGTDSQLTGVSCTSATACTAVGYSNGGVFTLQEVWDGTSWQLEPTINPTGMPRSELTGVSCTSAATCTAVGDGLYDGTNVTLAAASDGTSWQLQSTTNPTGATTYSASLNEVSCTSTTACTAAGSFTNNNPNFAGVPELPLAEGWGGSNWQVQSIPNPIGLTGTQDSSVIAGVSCTSATACIAVGSAYDQVEGIHGIFAEAWDGSGWQLQTIPSPVTTASLTAVSCTSATACIAVGYYDTIDTGAQVTLAEVWNGSSWQVQSTPDPTGATSSQLSGVSCSSATACIAVGDYNDSAGNEVTLAERWDGSSWQLQSTPNPTGATSSALNGVSCPSAKSCTAVGSYVNPRTDTQVTLAERWSGSRWHMRRPPNPTGATSSALNGVSCTSAKSCTAVGSYVNSAGADVMVAEGWDGSSWQLQSTPNPIGATSSALSGVSCTSAKSCTAVGTSAASLGGPSVPLAQRYS